jgi:hypothetical protein
MDRPPLLRVPHVMSSILAHPYRDPGPYRLPPEQPLERSSSGERRGLLAASLAAHVGIVLLVIYPGIERIDDPGKPPPRFAAIPDVRQVALAQPPSDGLDCRGPEAPFLYEESREYMDAHGDSASDGPEPPSPLIVAPSVLQRLRIAGNTQVQPGAQDQLAMRRDGVTHLDAVAKVCIASDGAVASAILLRSTGYTHYDAAVVSALRGCRYRPYLRNGIAHPVCSTFTIRR